MRLNPITKELFTNGGQLLKKLDCPLSKQWNDLYPTNSLKGKFCGECSKIVYDTSTLSDDQLSHLIKKDAHTCLKIDLQQDNLTITYNTNES